MATQVAFLSLGAAGWSLAESGSPSPKVEASPRPTAVVGSADSRSAVRLGRVEGRRPNVLLITIDTLRRDHLGVYGYGLPTSPSIDQIAREGVVLTDAITPVPTTAPAMASLLTGQHLERHRIMANVGALPGELPSLAEAFATAGYDTAGFYGNEAVEDFGRGFRTWEEFPRRLGPRGRELADDLGTTRVLRWLSSAREPWFLWVHFIDPHGPYDSSPASLSANFRYDVEPALERELEISEKNWVFGAIPRYQALPDAKRVVDYLRRYDGEILGTDQQVARLRGWLEENGELDRTLIVLTADHGESLLEDNYFFQHGKVLNGASLRIPMIFSHPELPKGARVDAPVSLIDLYPTLAELLGLEAPPAPAGISIAAALRGEVAPERTRITYTVTPDLQVSVQRGRWRLRGKPLQLKGGVHIDRFGRLFLFDTSQVPEQQVRLKDHPEVVARLRKELKKASRRIRNFEPVPVEPTTDQKERLRALGYLD